ncbi:uncharacterized protein LOC118318484 [Scophthalmus maximus]|uniref:uncharacterized protein LOC118318484 n=1 Tax=Scophthalmus maximus TaxID=52904 RepID=UPI001FA85821|nr:uncharacterized protein LOC118318484 [Scophthalmus maximus]
MAAERDDKREKIFRTPDPGLWIATALVVTYMVGIIVLPILTASGHLRNGQSFECGDSSEEEARLSQEASLGILWTGMCLPISIMLLVNIWIKKSMFFPLWLLAPFVLFVVMAVTFAKTWVNETQEIEAFKERYSALYPLTHVPGITQAHLNNNNCDLLHNVYRWQTEFKCCGLGSYQDWGSAIPDSCLCEGEDDSSGCVGVGGSLVYEKPCLPAVLSLVGKRSSLFWTIMTVWITIHGVPVAMFAVLMFVCSYWICFESCCYTLSVWKYKMSGGEEMVPVVFISKDNNNQTEEENGKDGEAKESGVVVDVAGGTRADGEGLDAAEVDPFENAVTMIPLSQLMRLQEELDPPPVQHTVRCLCIMPSKPKSFYTATIEEGSPLLPSGAMLADTNKPTNCIWAEGPHVFSVEHIVWPPESQPRGRPPL